MSTKVNGGAQFEICKAPADTLQGRRRGPSMGQFSKPRGVAVDNSPGGNGAVYVGDDRNYRIQKFTATGAPILAIGRGVNQMTGGNLCVIASGDDCSAGARAGDLEPAAFGGWPCPYGSGDICDFGTKITGYDEIGNDVAVDPNNGNLYVVDTYELGSVPGMGASRRSTARGSSSARRGARCSWGRSIRSR